jgi:hypothetical protein
VRWDVMKTNFTAKVRGTVFEWMEDDFIGNDYWTNGSFIFLHWTAFSTRQCAVITEMMCMCDEGAHVVTFTNPLQSTDFELLVRDICDTSWGKTEFYLHEKITPARSPAPVSFEGWNGTPGSVAGSAVGGMIV